ncbi:MAG: response regulator transcription factor, partial [Clostridia bacterium]|nr:response regulator transcription factor [Clostridia bacterium]
MKLAICDDERICREELIKLLNEYIAVNPGKDISFSEFSNADNILDSSSALDFDIYILDIVMPGLSGIELGKTLRSMGSKGKIIYLTSSEEFAVDSYKVKAANYILKPVCKDELFTTLDDIISEISENEEKSLIVKTADSITRVTYNSILYAELVKKSVVY